MDSISQGITIKILGGLGNQLFQYAVGRSMALQLGCPLYLDLRGIGSKRNRVYLLDQFTHAGLDAVGMNLPPLRQKSLRWRLFKNHYLQKHNMVFALSNDIDERLFNPKIGQYFSGNWQSETYFKSVAENIRKDFTLKQEPAGMDAEYLRKIDGCESVAVHVRRGDYLKGKKNLNRFAVCSANYYHDAAMMIIKTKRIMPVFFVFSDDIEWASTNLNLPGQVYFVDHNNYKSAHQDLRLMASCKHNIIANSTFSWWGAWLNTNTQKMVISPRQWYLGKTLSNDHINAGSFTLIDN